MRAELADLGEIPAGAEAAHDCAQPLVWPQALGSEGPPLFCAIDRHGAPETGWAISTRSITTIVAERLAAGEEAGGERTAMLEAPWRPRASGGVNDHDWGMAQRRAAEERFRRMEATLEEAEAPLARVHAAMGDALSSPTPDGEAGTLRPARADPP